MPFILNPSKQTCPLFWILNFPIRAYPVEAYGCLHGLPWPISYLLRWWRGKPRQWETNFTSQELNLFINRKKKELKQLIYKDLIPWISSTFIILSLFLSDIRGHWSLNHVISIFLSSTAQHTEMLIESRIESLIQLIFWHKLPRFKFEFWSAHVSSGRWLSS